MKKIIPILLEIITSIVNAQNFSPIIKATFTVALIILDKAFYNPNAFLTGA